MYGSHRTRRPGVLPLILPILLLLTSSLFAIEVPPTWVFETVQDADSSSSVENMIVDPVDGSIYISTTIRTESSREVQLEKISTYGESLWRYRFPQIEVDEFRTEPLPVDAIHLDSDRNLLVISSFQGYPSGDDETTTTCFLTRFTSSGTQVGQELWDIPEDYQLRATDFRGGLVYLACSSYRDADLDPPLVRVYTEAGDVERDDVLDMPTTNRWTINSLVALAQEKYVVAFNEDVDSEGSNLNRGKLRLIGFNETGSLSWQRSYNDYADYNGSLLAMKLDYDDNLIVSYQYSLYASSGARQDAVGVLEKVTPQGAEIWSNQSSIANPPYSPNPMYDLVLDTFDNIYTVGTVVHENSPDMQTASFTSTGQPIWSSIYTGPRGWDNGQHITMDGEGIIYSAGSSDGDPEVTSYHWDAAIAAYDSDEGTEQWTYRYNGSFGEESVERVTAIIPRPTGGVLMLVGVSLAEGSEAYGAILSWGGESAAPETDETLLPEKVALGAYPNPFNAQTTVTLTLPMSEHIQLGLYNLLGQQVLNLDSGFLTKGVHTLSLDASTLSSGTYLLRMTTDRGESVSRRITLLR